MPRTNRKAIARKNVRIPKPIVDEVDRIVRGNGLYVNRQQFIETAIREKIEESRLPGKKGADFLAHVKDTFLMHAIVNTVRGKTLPTNHLDLRQFERDVKLYIEKKAEREDKRITKQQLDELTNYLSEYHKKMLGGLRP